MELIDREALMRKHTAGPHDNKHDTAEELKHLLKCIEEAPATNETPCEMFEKMRRMERDSNELLVRFSHKCKERDELARALDQATVKLNDETARADALQRRCDDLEQSRQAWALKCEKLTGQLDETMKERERLKGLAEDYLEGYERCENRRSELESALYDLRDHPWCNLWRHIKEALGIG